MKRRFLVFRKEPSNTLNFPEAGRTGGGKNIYKSRSEKSEVTRGDREPREKGGDCLSSSVQSLRRAERVIKKWQKVGENGWKKGSPVKSLAPIEAKLDPRDLGLDTHSFAHGLRGFLRISLLNFEASVGNCTFRAKRKKMTRMFSGFVCARVRKCEMGRLPLLTLREDAARGIQRQCHLP